MRRYWYLLVALLAVFLIAGFLVGWVQLSLETDTYGVIFVRPRGFESEISLPSGFTWRWQRVIPKLLTLYRFPLSNQKADFTVRATLPSAEAYASIVESAPDFAVEIRFSATYRIRPEALPGLARDGGLRPEGLADYYTQTNADLERHASEIVLSSVPTGAPAADPTDPTGTLSLGRILDRKIREVFPHLDFLNITPVVVQAPDISLYLMLRDAYQRLLAAREESLKAMEPHIAEEETSQKLAVQNHERSIQLLERYGALLDKYPSLLKFLFLYTDLSPSALQNLDILGKLDALD